MTAKRRIVVLTHEAQPFVEGYYVRRMAEDHWGKAGYEVVVQRGLKDPPEADLAFLHVDATEIPAEYRALAQSYPRHVNATIASIARRTFSQNLVRRNDDYDGPVMLKTDFNRGGIPDLVLYRRKVKTSWNPVEHLVWRYRRSIAWRLRRLPNDTYAVYDNKALAPPWAWRDRRFVLEKFRPQFDGEYYYVNFWNFFGDRDIVMTFRQKDPVVRPDLDEANLEIHDRVPEVLRPVREDMGLTFGKFDYLLHDGEVVLVDVTLTPSSGERSHLPSRQRVFAALAPGIDGLFA